MIAGEIAPADGATEGAVAVVVEAEAGAIDDGAELEHAPATRVAIATTST